MSLFRVTQDKLEPVAETTFAAESLLERKDLQRLLRRDISPVGDDLMVIAEEYSNWEDSSRRIDLLCLKRDASLVVVEIKRTEDGGHMELQAIRYAAMVSSMTLEGVATAYQKMSGKEPDAATSDILLFLGLDSLEEAELTGDVRIVLVSADFSAELTTAVLWLNRHDLGIRCIRLRPYRIGADIVVVDATQIIPLPETTDYEVKVREQEKEQRKALTVRHETLKRFWAQLIERSKSKTHVLASRSPTTDAWLNAGIGRSGFGLNVAVAQADSQVECYMRIQDAEDRTRAAFEALLAQRAEIERRFGGPLEWDAQEGRHVCKVMVRLAGGWRSPESEWVAIHDRMIDALVRLEGALKGPIQNLSI
jgi:hypothetical protein